MAMYHPLEDVNHCFFRMLLLASHLVEKTTVETFRIMDFYCLFPSSLANIRLPKIFSQYKLVFKNIPKQYEPIPNNAALYDQLRHVQNNALGCLVSLGFLDRESFLNDLIIFTDQLLPTNVAQKMQESPIIKQDWFKFLTHLMPTFPVDGTNGWKARTHLSEFRYDIV